MSSPLFLYEDTPLYGEATHHTKNTVRVMCNNPGPFTYWGTGSFILGSNDADAALAIIDPGPAHAEDHLASLLAASKGRTPDMVIITHDHADHAGLARRLCDKTGACLIGPPPRKNHDTLESGEEGHDPTYQPDIILKDNQIINGGSWHLQAISTPGHTKHHFCYFDTVNRHCFTGDHIMGWATSVVIPPDGSMRDYMASLKKILDLKTTCLIPTHGPLIRQADQYINSLIRHRQARAAAILGCLEKGETSIMSIVESLYHDIDPRLYPAAARSVLAQLIAFIEAGKVKATPDTGLDSRFDLV